MLLARDKLEGVSPVAVLLADLAHNPHVVKRHRSLEPLARILRYVNELVMRVGGMVMGNGLL